MAESVTVYAPDISPSEPASSAPRHRKRRRYTLEEYLLLEEHSPVRHTYDAGKITPVPMAKGPHNEISANIISAIKIATKLSGKRYRIFSSNQKVYLPSLDMGLYPDVLVVGEAPEYWDEGELLLVNPPGW